MSALPVSEAAASGEKAEAVLHGLGFFYACQQESFTDDRGSIANRLQITCRKSRGDVMLKSRTEEPTNRAPLVRRTE
jgi:hypothetical protein